MVDGLRSFFMIGNAQRQPGADDAHPAPKNREGPSMSPCCRIFTDRLATWDPTYIINARIVSLLVNDSTGTCRSA